MTDALRRAVAEHFAGRCAYCRSPDTFAPGPFAVDHILPRTLGGTDALENLAWSCDGCNGHKAAAIQGSDPDTGEQVDLYHPGTMEWHDHFVWSEDGLTILGATPVGRATVDRLRLNRPGCVNLRRAMVLLGAHPPPSR